MSTLWKEGGLKIEAIIISNNKNNNQNLVRIQARTWDLFVYLERLYDFPVQTR